MWEPLGPREFAPLVAVCAQIAPKAPVLSEGRQQEPAAGRERRGSGPDLGYWSSSASPLEVDRGHQRQPYVVCRGYRQGHLALIMKSGLGALLISVLPVVEQ